MGLCAALKTKSQGIGNQCKGEKMLGFIVASVDKKSLKKVTKIDQNTIKYTSVLTENSDFIESEFSADFPEHQFIIAMPIEELKKQISFIEKLI